MTSVTSSSNATADQLLLGLVKSLEKRPGVCDVNISKQPPQKHEILNWEQKNACILPDDLKAFYLSTDGFILQWSAKINESKIPVGRMEINSITSLCRVTGTGGAKDAPNIRDIDTDEEEDGGLDKPHFDFRSRIFELDPCDGYGKVCLVYNGTKTAPGDTGSESETDDLDRNEDGIPATRANIWFMDRALDWHFLSETFTSYYRLMIMHLGLPQWHCLCTDIGLSPQAKQWFNVYAPLRLDVNQGLTVNEGFIDVPPNQVDVARVFKGKTEKKKAAGLNSNAKKKLGTVQSVKAPAGASRSATQANTGLQRPPMK